MSPACHAWLCNKLHHWSEGPGETCATLWRMCVSNMLLFADLNKLTLICLPSPYMFNKIHLNINASSLSSVTSTNLIWHWSLWPWQNPAADDDHVLCYILISLWKHVFGETKHANKRGHICVTWWYPAGCSLSPSCHNTKWDEKMQHKGSTGGTTRLWK